MKTKYTNLENFPPFFVSSPSLLATENLQKNLIKNLTSFSKKISF
jgi:hypothetical protein